MTKRDFLKRRKPAWRRFEQLLGPAGGVGPRRLANAQITDYSRLMREVSHDLAVVRAQGWDARLEAYLNDLASRGHNAFYRAPPGTTNAVVRYLAVRFPRLLRRNFGHIAAGCALFFVPFFVAWALVVAEPELAHRVVSSEELEALDDTWKQGGAYDRQMDEAAGAVPDYAEERTGMFGFYIWNNVGIAFRTFALGITLGVGTVVTLLFNGIAIGATFGYVSAQGNGERILSFGVTHGAFELTAIGISGGAGLMIADALLHPGSRTRWESLAVRGLEAVQVALGAGVMLAVAALLEAYWSPAPIPPVFKYVVGAALWLLVFAYVAFAGRGKEAERS
jgi:uncharacterized membrane protein SpoIIM required for sporulation